MQSTNLYEIKIPLKSQKQIKSETEETDRYRVLSLNHDVQ